MDSIDDETLKKASRASRRALASLLAALEERFEERDARGVRQAQSGGGSVVSTRAALAAALRRLAGASRVDLRLSWGVSMGSLYADDGALRGAMAAIDEALDAGLPLGGCERPLASVVAAHAVARRA